MGGGGGHSEAAPAPQAEQTYSQPQNTQYQNNPCQYELKQFMDCAQGQHDITLCQGFNEVLKDCRLRFGKMSYFLPNLIWINLTWWYKIR